MKLEKNVRNAAIGTAAAGVLAIGLVVAGTRGDPDPKPHAQPLVVIAPVERLRTDLLSSPVAPGEAGGTVVVLPHGSTLVPGFTLTGEAIGRFQITGTNLTDTPDGILLTVWFRSTSTSEARFTADFEYSVPSSPTSARPGS